MAKYGLLPKIKQFKDENKLQIKVLNLNFSNPIGIAAGFDKQGEAIEGLFKLGFGFVEIGSVVPKAQDGNPKPRVFRLNEDKAIINRYGFNSDGQDIIYERIEKFKNIKNSNKIIGINLGKNKLTKDTSDFLSGFNKFSKVADYLVINVSSPNTPGLRDLQHNDELDNLIKEVSIYNLKDLIIILFLIKLFQLVNERNKLGMKVPILVKISPDLNDDQLEDISLIVAKYSIDGIIVCNTTINRPNTLVSNSKLQEGGLSGSPLKQTSNELTKKMYKLTDGKITIIGVGGIENGRDALERIKNGASLIQLYTAMIYEGPIIANKIKKELIDLLK